VSIELTFEILNGNVLNFKILVRLVVYKLQLFVEFSNQLNKNDASPKELLLKRNV